MCIIFIKLISNHHNKSRLIDDVQLNSTIIVCFPLYVYLILCIFKSIYYVLIHFSSNNIKIDHCLLLYKSFKYKAIKIITTKLNKHFRKNVIIYLRNILNTNTIFLNTKIHTYLSKNNCLILKIISILMLAT